MITAIISRPRRKRRLYEERGDVKGPVDRDAGIIRSVKIIGPESQNGRTYSREALREAVHLYENCRVLIDYLHGRPRVEMPVVSGQPWKTGLSQPV